MKAPSALKVLVTRPQGQAQGLLTAIEQAGAAAWHYPVMTIAALDPNTEPQRLADGKQLVLQLDQFQHIIFISTNAVAFGMEWINQYWPQLPLGMHWHGIGKKTIAALAQAGAPVIESALDDNGPMDSEALLADLQLCNLTQQKILIVRGVGGRETLREQLQQRGAKVSYIECYQRQRVDRPVGEIAELIRQHGINSICVNSGESLQHLCYLIGPEALPAIKKLLLVTPGERVAEIARQLQFEQIAVASNASDPYMLAALLESYAGAH